MIMNSQTINKAEVVPSKKTILIIDDDIYNIHTLETLFHSDGFRTVTANQGEQALRILNTIDVIHAIVLDLKMPVMDGFEFLSKLHSTTNASDIPPIVVLSANITNSVTERLRQFNVNGIMEKPFEIDELIEHVNTLIEYKANPLNALNPILDSVLI